MCLGMAITLGISSNQSGYIFTLVFTLVWMGSLMVTANARLLGYKMYWKSYALLNALDHSFKMYA